MKINLKDKLVNFEEFYNNYSVKTKKFVSKTKNFYEYPLENEEVELASEVSISIIINEKFKYNLLCTPAEIEFLIIGYLASEGFIQTLDQILGIEYIENNFLVNISENINNFENMTEIRSSGCVGVKQQYEEINIKVGDNLNLSAEVLFKSQEEMSKMGKVWKKTGGTHMSALCDKNGKIISFSEDIGRHNTLDKVIGKSISLNHNFEDLYMITSGRISAASIAKIVRLKISLIASISTALEEGIKIAERCNITVVGFCRDPALTVYTHPYRIEKLKYN